MLREHVIGHVILLPGVGFIELALSVGLSYSEAACLADVVLVQPCALDASGNVVFRHSSQNAASFDIATLKGELYSTHVMG